MWPQVSPLGCSFGGMDHHHDEADAEPIDYRALIAAESQRFALILDKGPLGAPVSGCPGWTLSDLGAHLGDVQRWAATIISTGGKDANEYERRDQSLASWFREGTQLLLDAVDGSTPTDECWNLWASGQKTKQFWYRRQALETAVHRWDAEAAATPEPTPFDAVVGADIVDEWVHVLLERKLDQANVDLTTLDGDVHFHCTDTAGEWTFEVDDGKLVVSDEHRKSAVAVRGPASDLALLCYQRADRSGVEIFGDVELLDRWLSDLS